jgi:hypothetical protein
VHNLNVRASHSFQGDESDVRELPEMLVRAHILQPVELSHYLKGGGMHPVAL